MAAGLHISISAERLLTLGGLNITNSMFTSVLVSLLLISFAIITKFKLKNVSKPTVIQNFAEMIVEALHGLVHGVTGDLKRTRLFFPFISTFFLVIILNNWLGLIPGVGTIKLLVNEEAAKVEEVSQTEKASDHSNVLVDSVQASEAVATEEAITLETEEATQEETPSEHSGPVAVPIFRPGTADINTTISLALISIIVTQIFGVKYLKFGYFKKFINFSSPIMFFVGILELISEFAKIISFAFRLFGNIFAGEVLLVVMAFLFPVILPMPFYGLELFVGFIQALVFSMLTLVFFNMATISHEEH
ncbi:MAG: ATP synthase F0 subunit A [Candidatus Pacebacteria bacterium CG_4_10_14_3_um_filter_34_15]|nr:F0F1 ATP synthase subunit A [Candidatus Pacearchaeota archaeon]NCQ65552.1 F0F1 ATP synthase subunit A [Candidatus Paceibacterota bacterium]PIQ81296.1 MAG: ATP synthase F0 subunit A [Candidatus Pacebacteria bacterium CG11_big_fil_rev_8_21_14_0_20_34_55]PIX81123.1 MAG: ATP synthase F0 subunit A [Candidatus Pacebacteria bacterium CG_4_10_14_3_um_filter_34_15]PJC43842.1 MAG: ATP synthase F0 subunit A [Candidatus Pacebacteria bacterium CG_4_9_14_0_2_um_filter_34_50]